MNMDDGLSGLLRQATQVMAANYAGRDGAVTIPQMAVLNALDLRGSLSSVAITKAVKIDRSSLAEILYRLQAAGMVVRVPNPFSRREVLTTITKQGHVALLRSRRALLKAEVSVLGMLPEPKRAAFLFALQTIAKGAHG